MTIFATGAIAGTVTTILLFSMLSMLSSVSVRSELSAIGTMLSYLVSIAVGVFVGFILQKMLKIGAAIIGAIGGFLIGFTLHNVLFYWTQSEIMLMTLSILGALAMAILSLKQYDNIVMIGTSMMGSYCFVRGFTLLIGDDTLNESTIIDRIETGDISTEFYLYVAVFLIVFAMGSVYQRKQHMLERLTNYIKL